MNAVRVRSVPRPKKRRRRRFLREAKIPVWAALLLTGGMFINLLSNLLRAFEFWTCVLTVIVGLLGCVLAIIHVHELRTNREQHTPAHDHHASPDGAP